jgi:phage gpG-like protein
VRLNPEGTQWKAVIYQVDWKGLQTTRKLDNNLISTIDDDACIQGTRPEYVQYKNSGM